MFPSHDRAPFIWGGKKYDYDYHFTGWDEDCLTNLLLKAGFDKVRKWDTFKSEHFYVDDYSKAFLPHMDFKNGRQMSLNLEAVAKKDG